MGPEAEIFNGLGRVSQVFAYSTYKNRSVSDATKKPGLANTGRFAYTMKKRKGKKQNFEKRPIRCS